MAVQPVPGFRGRSSERALLARLLETTGLAIPALFEWQGPAVVTSVTTGVLRDTRDHRATWGDVQVTRDGS